MHRRDLQAASLRFIVGDVLFSGEHPALTIPRQEVNLSSTTRPVVLIADGVQLVVPEASKHDPISLVNPVAVKNKEPLLLAFCRRIWDINPRKVLDSVYNRRPLDQSHVLGSAVFALCVRICTSYQTTPCKFHIHVGVKVPLKSAVASQIIVRSLKSDGAKNSDSVSKSGSPSVSKEAN